MTRARVKITGHEWAHTFELTGLAVGVVYATGLWFTTGARGHAWLPFTAVAVITVGVMLTTVIQTSATQLPRYFGAWGLLILAWFGYITATSAWTADAAFWLAAPAALLGVWGAHLFAGRASETHTAEAAAEQQRAVAAATRWANLFKRLNLRVAVADVTPTLGGEVVHLHLPDNGGVTYATLCQQADRIEIAAKLRRNCIRFEQRTNAAEVDMHVAARDVLADRVPFPADISPISIRKPFPVGRRDDGALEEILFREIAALIVGVRGSGKSNLLNVFIAQLCRCVDTLVFVIDNKGGRTAAPWVLPWLHGKCPRPAVDWVATTPTETEIMLRACVNAIDARSRSLRGGTKIKPSADQPAIIVVCDEVAVIFGMMGPRRDEGPSNRQLAALGDQMTQLGRSEAVDGIWCSLRGFSNMTGGTNLKSQCDLRIALGAASADEVRAVIPDDAAAARLVSRLEHAGAGMVKNRKARGVPVKFFDLDSDGSENRVYQIAAELGAVRPGPDQLTADAMGEDYARRWERAGAVTAAWLAGSPGRPALPGTGAGTGAGSPAGAPGTVTLDPATVETEFSRLAGSMTDPDAQLDPRHRLMRELLSARGSAGAMPFELALSITKIAESGKREGIKPVSREVVSRWLARDADLNPPLCERIGDKKSGRWRITRPGS